MPVRRCNMPGTFSDSARVNAVGVSWWIDSRPAIKVPFNRQSTGHLDPAATMNPTFYRISTRHERLSWLLILTFLSLTLFPHHYHLHHVTDSALHDSGIQEHVTDIHVRTYLNDTVHHGDGHIIKSVADAPLKNHGAKLSWVVILVTFMLFLPLFAQAGCPFPLSIIHRLPRSNRHTTPPLRAPPRT